MLTNKQVKGVTIMKKMFVLGFVAALNAGAAMASDGYYETSVSDCGHVHMMRELNRAAADTNAVVTVVKCNKASVQAQRMAPVPAQRKHYAPCAECAQPIEQVVNREYFVRETVQTYQPVTVYVPGESYNRVRPVCGNVGC